MSTSKIKRVKGWMVFYKGKPARDLDPSMFMVFAKKPRIMGEHEYFTYSQVEITLPPKKKK